MHSEATGITAQYHVVQQRTIEHPCDVALRTHILDEHEDAIVEVLLDCQLDQVNDEEVWAVYRQALAVQERQDFPTVGPQVDRGAFEYTMRVYNDKRIRSLICYACACICLDTGGARSQIEFKTGAWLLNLPVGSFRKNFSFEVFSQRSCKVGPLAFRGNNER